MARIVIIGGMGPQAGLELHRRIIRRAREAGARRTEDFPEVVHLSVPVSDFISSGDGAVAFRRLKRTLTSIPLRQSDRVAIACNTAHLLLPDLESAMGIRFMSMIDTVVDAVRNAGFQKIGLLASPTTIHTRLYERAFAGQGIVCLLPSERDQARIEDIIRSVIADDYSAAALADLQEIATGLIRAGAEGIVLGCTELPLVFTESKADFQVFDCLNLMADRLVVLRTKRQPDKV